jgi:MoaA/NifB/PqqE/SkfB family radical SAM enzyme
MSNKALPIEADTGIEVKLTNRCNLKCKHCMNKDSKNRQEDLDVSVFLRKLEEYVHDNTYMDFKVNEVRITGGEPLIHLQEVERIGRLCRKLGVRCGINTNGSLLTPAVASRLKASGIERAKISIDSTDDANLKQIRGDDLSVKQILASIKNATDANLDVILRFTLMRQNQDHLFTCYDIARSYKIKEFQIKPLVKTGRALNFDDFLSPDEVEALLQKLASVTGSNLTQPIVLCWPSNLCGGLSWKTCGSINKIYISTNSKVTICNYVHDIVSIGDLSCTSLKNILSRRNRQPVFKTSNGERVVDGCPQLSFFVADLGPFS